MPARIRPAASQLRGAKVKANVARGNATCDALLRQLPERMQVHVREHVFAPPRRFRFDIAWPYLMLAVEVHGGTWSGGGHVRGAHFASDCEKGALALMGGWRVLAVTTEQVHSGKAAEWLRRIAEVPHAQG